MPQLRNKQLEYPLSGSFTGSLLGTASYADYSTTSSFGVSSSYSLSSSYSVTSSYSVNSTSASYSISSSNSISSSYSITSSYSEFSISSSYSQTASYAPDYLLISQTGSMTVLSASYASSSLSASYSVSSSYSDFSISSSYSITSSYSQDALSSSYAATASFAPAYLPLTGGTINGDVILNGTASIAFLNVTYESASVIYSTGSNQFGDAADDVQTLYGAVNIPTGSLTVSGSTTITGSLNVTSGITGSIFGSSSYAISSSYSDTSISASYALTATTAINADTASNILGGVATHVPYFITDTTLATSSIYQSGSTSIIINQNDNTTANPEALYVWQPHPTSINVISGKGLLNNYLQLNIQNTDNGISASSDIVATANNGTETEYYIDMGINGQSYGYYLGGPNDAYLYTHGNNFLIGNVNDGYKVYFFNSSSLQPIITLNSDNAEITGSLYGTSSFAVSSSHSSTSISSSYSATSTSASYALSSTSASYSVTASYSNRSTSASYALTATSADSSTSASHAVQADNAATADFATYAATAGNGGVTQLIAGSGIALIPAGGTGAVTIASSGGGGTTVISGSNVTQSFSNLSTWTFNHNQGTRTPIITTFDSNYNQIIPQNIELTDTSSVTITFPEPVSGFAIASLGGTTGTVISSSYSLFSTYATTASYYFESDPVFVAKSASLATTGSNTFRGNQTISGSLFTTGSNTLVGNTFLTGSLNITGSTVQTGNNTLIGNTTLSGSFEVSGSSNFHNSEFTVTGSTYIKGITAISGSTDITGSLNVIGNINVVSGSSFTRWGNKLFNYGQFANTSSISVTANVSGAFAFPYTYFSDGINISNTSRINFENTGLYNIQFSALANQGNAVITLHIWFKKTGSNIDNSDTVVTLQNNTQTLLAWNFAYPFNAGEYVELWYYSNGNQTSFPANPAGSGFPATPSIICTVTQIA